MELEVVSVSAANDEVRVQEANLEIPFPSPKDKVEQTQRTLDDRLAHASDIFMDLQQKEIQTLKDEVIALRVENERLRDEVAEYQKLWNQAVNQLNDLQELNLALQKDASFYYNTVQAGARYDQQQKEQGMRKGTDGGNCNGC